MDDIDAQPGQLDFLHACNLPHKPWTVVPSLQSYTDPGELHEHAGARERCLRAPGRDRRPQAPPARGRRSRRLVGEVVEKLEDRGRLGRDPARRGRRPRDQLQAAHRQAPRLRQQPRPARLRAPVHQASRRSGGAAPTRRPCRRSTWCRPSPTLSGSRSPGRSTGCCPASAAPRRRDRQLQGPDHRVTASRAAEAPNRFVAAQSKVLRTGRGWDALIESGPGSELIGRRVPAALPDAPGEADVLLSADPDDPDTVDAVVAGSIEGAGPRQAARGRGGRAGSRPPRAPSGPLTPAFASRRFCPRRSTRARSATSRCCWSARTAASRCSARAEPSYFAPSFAAASRRFLTVASGALRPSSFSPWRLTQITGTFIFRQGAMSAS